MRRFEIKSVKDRNFLVLGIVFIALGMLVYSLSFSFGFPGIIALKGGVGTGVLISSVYFLARLFAKP